ncbi:hypothetical protein [Bosea psychrotolerans]|uniref:hypothetical protein n=1 Tax=Bosea psychrotolerans TaxID=1871628 RepID=UPI000CDAE36E|nr:hypothetical protein [Bosea psychrotolerans]
MPLPSFPTIPDRLYSPRLVSSAGEIRIGPKIAFQKRLPKENTFFDLFESHPVTLVASAEALNGLLAGVVPVPEGCAEVIA